MSAENRERAQAICMCGIRPPDTCGICDEIEGALNSVMALGMLMGAQGIGEAVLANGQDAYERGERDGFHRGAEWMRARVHAFIEEDHGWATEAAAILSQKVDPETGPPTPTEGEP